VSTWREIADLFLPEDGPLHHMLVGKVLRHGEEAIQLSNGGYYRVVATNRRAARGLRAVDLLWLDEARELKSWDAMAAMTPTTAVSPNPLTVVTSNAGELDSVVLNQLRERGLAAAAGRDDPRLCWLEWSAPDDADPADMAAARQANPSPRITDAYLADQYASLPRNRYKVEHLCQWVDTLQGVIPAEVWAGLVHTGPPPPVPGALQLVYSVDRHYRDAVVMAAGRGDDGIVYMRVLEGWKAEPGDQVSIRDVAEGVIRATKQLGTRRVGYHSYNGAAVAQHLARMGLVFVDCKGEPYVSGCARLVDAVNTGAVRHDGDPLLTANITAASRREGDRGGGAWWFDPRSAGSIAAAEAAAMLMHLCEPEHARPRLMPIVAT
jgi:hypothetical protein